MALDGKVAIVTGAASGIGLATAWILAERGAKVVLTDIQDGGAIHAVEIGANARFMRHDVADAAQWTAVVADTEAVFGPVSVLINNAGISPNIGTAVDELDEADYRRIIDVNQVSVFLGMKAVVPSMRGAGGGSIVNASSALGLVAAPGAIGYIASKFAITGMTKAAALDLGKYGIRVNAVHPGLVDTPLMNATRAQGNVEMQELTKAFPIPRAGTAAEIAMVFAFLASDDASFCTGASFAADGGWTAM